ncbi:hypothetical protein GCM10009641_00970 [Mycobacterium cookii]|uniref:Uncharacterized protein n=1 Tax=Mycobacterium cookii TaxID=1775 RepID=A0A7I7L488_9MYCO|nr:hypothetical protein MCOO_48720 [Mycobacterium cookii]
MARLGLIALGLGIGGAFAAIPGTASADSSDWLAAVDGFLSGVAVPAASDASSGLNLAISFDGATLYQDGTAYAYTGDNGDIAIANGAGAHAYAFGTNNYASVDGTDSTAVAGGYDQATAGTSADNTAFAFGNNDTAFAGTTDAANPGSFNYSIIFGNGDGAYSGGTEAGAGSYDGAYVEGNNLATAYAQGGNHLLDLVKFYGDGAGSGTAAATDLLGSDPSGALADGNAFWTDLFSGDTAGALTAGHEFWADMLTAFDGGSLAADAGNLWTDVASLF